VVTFDEQHWSFSMSVSNCAERLDETRHFEIIAKGMRALDISTVRDIPTAWPSKR
jgi:hypothetical protein